MTCLTENMIIVGYEYKVNLQTKMYYLVKQAKYKYRVFLYVDMPDIRVKMRKDSTSSFRPPDPIIKICKTIEYEDLIAFNALSLIQFNFGSSNIKQTMFIRQTDQVILWEKYYKVKTLTFL